MSTRGSGPPDKAGVQSVNRALDVLEVIAAAQKSMTVGDVASAVALPVPTAHRLLRTLLDRGYARQLPDRTYALGFRLVALGAAANIVVGADAQAVLGELVAELGESANLAVLAGDTAQYIAQAPSRFSMRMFTEVGRNVDLHCTGVGKALLAQLDPADVDAIIRRRGLSRYTENTIVTHTALNAELVRIRERGFAIDEQEQELGVRCVAVPVVTGGVTAMAVSVSGPTVRMTCELVDRAVPLLKSAAQRLGHSVATSAPD